MAIIALPGMLTSLTSLSESPLALNRIGIIAVWDCPVGTATEWPFSSWIDLIPDEPSTVTAFGFDW